MTLAKRIIPCLDVDAGRVVKGVRFEDLRDAGDPVELAARYDAEGGDAERFPVTPGQAYWDEPGDLVHRGVNVGQQPYEEIAVFFLDRPDAVAQPREDGP